MGFIEHKESGAPLGVCKVGLGQSLLEKGTTYLFIFFFLHHCHRPQRSPGVHLTPFSVIFSVKDEE